ncbi:hypothetical protein G3I76_18610, partial [Streptomyces sp. SID11233]|nr:hypothetical protein [Streptomyces sp. SID11233]
APVRLHKAPAKEHAPPATGAHPSPAPEPEVVHADQVEGDEPLLPARVHRPYDLLRLCVGVLALAIVLGVAAFAHGTTS